MLRMTRLVAVLGMTVVASAGCERLPDEIVYVTGTVTKNGQPLAGVEVVLERSRRCDLGWLTAFPPDQDVPPDEELDRAASDENGLYVLELLYGQTRVTRGSLCFRAHHVSDAHGEFWAEFSLGEGDGDLGTINLANGASEVSVEGDSLRLRATGLPSSLEPSEFQRNDAQQRGLVVAQRWEAWAGRPTFSTREAPFWMAAREGDPAEWLLSPREFEDFATPYAAPVLRQEISDDWDDEVQPFGRPGNNGYLLLQWGTPVALTPATPAVLPASRGAQCFAGSQSLAPDENGACPLTDGSMVATVYAYSGPWLELRFERAFRPDELLIRGWEGNVDDLGQDPTVIITGSSDGENFAELGRGALSAFSDRYALEDGEYSRGFSRYVGYGRIPLTSSDAITHLRLQRPEGASVAWTSLGELSVFEQTP